MLRRRCFTLVLIWPAALLVGCGVRDARHENPASATTPPSTSVAKPSTGMPSITAEATIHVKDMKDKLNLTGITGTNNVKEALLGLPGVQAVKWDGNDLDDDLVHVRFDPARITLQKMLEVIPSVRDLEGRRVLGLQGKVVPAKKPAGQGPY